MEPSSIEGEAEVVEAMDEAIEEEYLDAAQASDLGHLGEVQAS
jgi:hypothetical protein